MRGAISLGDLNRELVHGGVVDVNSIHDYFYRLGGREEFTVITLSASAGAESVNICQVFGSVQIYRLYAYITDATTLTNLTDASFDILPTGSPVIQISAASGVLSGMPVDTFIVKGGLKTDPFDVNNAATGGLVEQTYEGSDIFSRIIVTQKAGADTFVRFTYTTTDAPINAQLTVYVEYRGLNGGYLVMV